MTPREFALEVVRKLQQAGFVALWAGGCVRDQLLGLPPQDYDVATNAQPKDLRPLFPRRNEIGAHFGVVQVIGPRGDDGRWLTLEVATFRQDGPYGDGGRRPDWVRFCSPEEDAKRRDFTINGMFYDPVKGELIDYVGGRADLQARVLRAIGRPEERFAEDKLRILRAVRIAARFDLTIDPATLAAARRMAPLIRVVSAERIADELRKVLAHASRGRGVQLLREFNLIEPILPELVPTFGLPQRPRGGPSLPPPTTPAPSVWDHSVRVVEVLPADALFPLAFAALLHDCGKTVVPPGDDPTDPYPGHERAGRPLVEAIAERLRLSNAEKTHIGWLVESHAVLLEAPTMRLARLKPLLSHPDVADLLELHRANAVANGRGTDHVAFCERMLKELPPHELDPPPVVTGVDLIALGLCPGPQFKRLLEAVREAQLEGQVRTKAEGLALVRRLAGLPEPGPGTPLE